jgi:tetratricopeptide (TPR) repeat protein
VKKIIMVLILMVIALCVEIAQELTLFTSMAQVMEDPVEPPLLSPGDYPHLFERLKPMLQKEAGVSPEEFAVFWEYVEVYEVDLGKYPPGVYRQVFVLLDYMAYLVGVDQSGSQVCLLGKGNEPVVINQRKMEIKTCGNQVFLWSQKAFSAIEKNCVLAWDGKQLRIIKNEIQDPVQMYFDQREKYIARGDIEGLKEFDRLEGKIMYPLSYAAYFEQPKKVARKAHEVAMKRYKAGDLAGAVKILSYGLNDYAYVFWSCPVEEISDVSVAEIEGEKWTLHKEDLLPVAELVVMLNNYAFFLAEAGEHQKAEGILLKVIDLAPNRAVAYINLGDVCWELGKIREARDYYRKYLKLLGKNTKKVPKRVYERVKE